MAWHGRTGLEDGRRCGRRGPSGAASGPGDMTAGDEFPPPRGRLFPFLPTGTELGVYVSIECCWHSALFAVCYRYRPLVALGKTPWGARFLDRTCHFFEDRGGRLAAGERRCSCVCAHTRTPTERGAAVRQLRPHTHNC